MKPTSQEQVELTRKIASEHGISVTKARVIVSKQISASLRSERDSRGVSLYQFRPLSPKHRRIDGGEFATDQQAEDACAVLVAEDGINRQVVKNGSLIRVVTK